jgi:hypothetical protein
MKKDQKLKLPQKGAGKALKEIYEQNRKSAKASKEFLEIISKKRDRPKSSGKQNDKKKGTLKKVSTPKSDPDRWKTSEFALTKHLDEDLQDAWKKLKEFSLSLGEQKMYASGKAIMFSKKTCFFFVRPQKTYLEVVIFLKDKSQIEGFKPSRAVSKTKYAHSFKLIHSDQVEGELTEAILRAFNLET